MPDINSDERIKIICFYLPQFHSIPENDYWWGKDFTEWVNVKKAIPQYPGHCQPRRPLQNNYYCLLDDRIKMWQSEIAAQYGVYGFCYYHYWFKGGKKLLERPIEQMLANPEIKAPFCLSWANENWTRNWDGGNREIIMEQDYGGETEWEEHFLYLLNFFKDERYITFDEKPVLLIYKPWLIDKMTEMIQFFTSRSIAAGFKGICFIFQRVLCSSISHYQANNFDYTINFEPGFTNDERIGLKKFKGFSFIYNRVNRIYWNIVKKSNNFHLRLTNYDSTWEQILNRRISNNDKIIPSAFVDWDNTPRNRNGRVYFGSSPKKFKKYMIQLIRQVREKYHQKMIFINAWNEWGEGAYLEPDEQWGYGYLEAVRDALKEADDRT